MYIGLASSSRSIYATTPREQRRMPANVFRVSNVRTQHPSQCI
ncbi:MAG: hypothetical protein VB124_01710 [Burkholderia sp.]